jgi:hypothetical protein
VGVGFVGALAATVIIGLRAIINGKLVSGKVHDEVRFDRDTYRKAAETTLEANRELAQHVGRLVTMVEQLAKLSTENHTLIRQLLAEQQPNNRVETT